MRSRALSSVALAALALTAVSCGGKSVKRNIAEDPQRGGGTLEPISARYNDLKPSISRDGTRFVFVSGRDATDAAPSLKVYKAEWPAGAAPAAATRVTTTDFGVEKEARLSPDGNWIVMTTVKDGRNDLVLVDFAGTKVAKITDDAAVETGPAFSPDSKLLTWVTRGTGTTNASVWVLEIQDDLAAAAAAKVRATVETDSPAAAFFTQAASGYQLGVALQSPGKGAWDMKLKTFATLAEVAAATPADWLGIVPAGPSPVPAAGAARVAFVRRLLPSQPKQATTLTAPYLKEKAEKRPVISEVVYVDAKAGPTEPVAVTAPIVAEVLGASLSEDGLTAFVLGRNNYLCDDVVEGFRYGAFFLTGAADGSTLMPLVPVINPDGSNWLIGLDPCQKLYDKFVRLDDKISEVEVNGAAKSDTFRALYTTRFTKAFDVDCRLRVGDPEIMALDVKGTERVIYAASGNPAPLASADRGDQPACQL